MKKIFIAATLLLALCVSACGGKSDASKEQISKGRDEAKAMLKETHRQQPEQTPAVEQDQSKENREK